MSHLKPTIPCPALIQQTINSLWKIHVSNKLRLFINSLTEDPANILESIKLAQLILFNTNIQDWMETEDFDIHIKEKLLYKGSN